jgi:hypothetical protein
VNAAAAQWALLAALESPWPYLITLAVTLAATAAWGVWPLYHRRRALPDEPVPYWPTPQALADPGTGHLTAAVKCRRCSGRGGLCTCLTDCGRDWCTGDRPTIRAAWSADELAALRGEKELPR